MIDLTQKSCKPCEGGVLPLSAEKVKHLMEELPSWETDKTGVEWIARSFEFKNFYHTMAFVNAIAWMAHQENHHPDLELGYHYCKVRYSTHALNGLSENDFICAAKVDALMIA
jgi:4a-hydroxytetrahydrobiopterin dehydratase